MLPPIKALQFLESSSNRKCHFKETRLESIRHIQNYKVSDEYFLCLSVSGGFVCLLVLFSRSEEHETIWESDMPAGGNTAAFEICVRGNMHLAVVEAVHKSSIL